MEVCKSTIYKYIEISNQQLWEAEASGPSPTLVAPSGFGFFESPYRTCCYPVSVALKRKEEAAKNDVSRYLLMK